MSEEKNLSLVERLQVYSKAAFTLIHQPGDSAATQAIIDEAYTAICEKADAYGHVMAQLEAFASQCKARKEEWQTGERAAKNTIDSLKERMRYVLSQLPEHEISGEEFEFFLTRASERLAIDASLVPKEYMRAKIVYEPDAAKIEAAIVEGIQIPGVTKIKSQQLRSRRPKK
jgi:hypothetical protein